MSAPETTQRPSAGRPLGRATAVGLSLFLVLAACLLLPVYVFAVLIAVGICVGLWEIRTALTQAGYLLSPVALLGTGLLLPTVAYFYGAEGLITGLLCVVPVVLLWRLLAGGSNAVRDAVCAAFVVTWIPFLASFLIVLIQQDKGPAKVLTAVLVTAASDTGGYMVGVFIGRHPMAPLVSPKKSWEGFGGSIVVSLIFAIACVVFLLDGPWWVGVVLGVLATLSATVGDLGESLVKRDLKIKDMSQILPGHGGLLDRVDSLLVTVPMVWLVLAALLTTS